MSKSNVFENDYMKLMFNNIAMTLVGDAAGLLPSGAAGSLYLTLHTNDPGETGDQTTNEAAYTGYARVAVARSAAGFTVTENAVNLTANADFPVCTAAPGATLTHFGIGTSAAGAGKLLYSGTLAPNVIMNIGVQPRITTAPNLVTED